MASSARRGQALPAYPTRAAAHAGSWYSEDAAELAGELDGYLAEVAIPPELREKRVRAIIAPHAGYRYSGPTAAWAFAYLASAIKAGSIRRVFILGPSHHVHLDGCAVSGAGTLATPVGELPVDTDTAAAILGMSTPKAPIRVMRQGEDEEEHSLEMEMPYVARVTSSASRRSAAAAPSGVTVVPIMVGSTDAAQEAAFGRLLAPFLDDDSNIFVISSDFCHWGRRFRYTPHDKTKGEVWQSIQAMDNEGMMLIEQQNTAGFTEYLRRTENTICGRHPIGVLLNMLANARARHAVKFVKYAQSSHVRDATDSSVSYASAVVYIP